MPGTRKEFKQFSVSVILRFVRAFNRHAKVVSLLRGERGELDADLFKMQPRYFFIELLGQHVDANFVGVLVGPQIELRQGLVGKAVATSQSWDGRWRSPD